MDFHYFKYASNFDPLKNCSKRKIVHFRGGNGKGAEVRFCPEVHRNKWSWGPKAIRRHQICVTYNVVGPSSIRSVAEGLVFNSPFIRINCEGAIILSEHYFPAETRLLLTMCANFYCKRYNERMGGELRINGQVISVTPVKVTHYRIEIIFKDISEEKRHMLSQYTQPAYLI